MIGILTHLLYVNRNGSVTKLIKVIVLIFTEQDFNAELFLLFSKEVKLTIYILSLLIKVLVIIGISNTDIILDGI